MFIVNNASTAELQYAINLNLTVSVDSVSQLETYGKLNHGGKICLRFNPGIGGGHHEKVITGGDGTKFGIMPEDIPRVREVLRKYDLRLIGINHHIGSQNWGDLFLEGAKLLLAIAKKFPDIEFVDLGGGFAIPYNKQGGEQPMDLRALGNSLDKFLYEFSAGCEKNIDFYIEPGRYVVCECGVLLGTVNAIKNCGQARYAGTDMGFSVFARPTLYDAHHDIEIYRKNGEPVSHETEIINIVGDQCESGDYIAKERPLPLLQEGDVLGVLDAGAYGYSMSSQYNHRPRPAEILIKSDGSIKQIRRRDTFEDMLENMKI
jgi:diaminopimelate decarboxylase